MLVITQEIYQHKDNTLDELTVYEFKLYIRQDPLIFKKYNTQEHTFKFLENEVYVYNSNEELVFEYFGSYVRVLE